MRRKAPVPMDNEAIARTAMLDLMNWFEVHRRPMPWRGEFDPYKIWISEVMLQQTQVAAVIPYYERWIARFPTVHSLAESDMDTILELWQGLGYYSRSRHLLMGARFIVERYRGRFPETLSDILRIPGVGDYIAGALCSIAFNQPEPAVDGNAIRVIARIRALAAPSPAGLKRMVADIIRRSFHDLEPRWVSQAWMELGALQCTPRPVCPPCPFAAVCSAFITDRVSVFPTPRIKKASPTRRGIIFIIRRNDRILMVKRPDSGLLPGLWELPNVFEDDPEFNSFPKLHNLTIIPGTLGTVRHAYSHFKVICEIRQAELLGPWIPGNWVSHRWMSRSDLNSVGKPGLHIKALTTAGF